jgi:hypothetical protein
MWIVTVLKSEFFWGVIVGLVLSVFGAYWLAVFGARQQQKAQKDQIKNLCIDTVNNLRAIVDDGDAPDFVEVGEAGIAMDDAMRRQRRVQLVG